MGRAVCQGWSPGKCPIPVMKELKRRCDLYLIVMYYNLTPRLSTELPRGKKLKKFRLFCVEVGGSCMA